MKKEMHRRMHNNDFDIVLRSVHYSAKLQIAKSIKTPKSVTNYLQGELGLFAFSLAWFPLIWQFVTNAHHYMLLLHVNNCHY